MDKLENQVITEKSIRLLQQNQYIFKVDSKATKTEIRNWIEQLFDVKVEGTNSSSIRIRSHKKGKKSHNYRSSKKMIVRLKDNSNIPSFLNQI
uniref:Large ribosomal subunit protein uL23c n=1 Tax=Scoliosorus ensiformis TaxID=38541 RepID=A0A3G5CUJ2_9MONI|nr:ribosomal protein L23 [Scoliosorus ensiformis]AYW16549.1 ribosomal protein L23 [Scoliosorus ensiformis]